MWKYSLLAGEMGGLLAAATDVLHSGREDVTVSTQIETTCQKFVRSRKFVEYENVYKEIKTDITFAI